MLKLILALLPLVANVKAQQAAKPTATKAPVQMAKKVTNPASSGIQGIPAGAVKIDENTYRWQEKDASGKPGKVWLFRRNPFGVSKVEEREAAKIGLVVAAPVDTPAATATDLGDSYRFERPGPFGAKIWFKKKSELNDDERGIAEKAIAFQKAAN